MDGSATAFVGGSTLDAMPSVFLNGEFVEAVDASVSAFDSGLLHGVGLFETIKGGLSPSGQPRAFRLADHLDRLTASARGLRLTDQAQVRGLNDAVLHTIGKAGYEHARVRLTMTGGDLNLLGGQQAGADRLLPTVLIEAKPATAYPEAMFEEGVLVTLADPKANPFAPDEGHKTLNYWWRLRALQDAAAKNAGEALVFQVTNHLAGGCVSNAFVVKDGVLLTPIARGEEEDVGGSKALPSPVLPGITRGFVLGAARSLGVETSARMLSITDVLEADEVFLTNASWGVLPVKQVESREIGSGRPGDLTRRLRADWVDAVEAAFGDDEG